MKPYFRFSCDTNIIISSAFYYRFKSTSEIFREGTIYDYSIFLMRFFERILKKKKIKFGIITPSTLKEIKERKISILMKKIEERYQKDASTFKKVINEMSALLNQINDNLQRILKIFTIGKAYSTDKRVKKYVSRVTKMYDGFIDESTKIEEEIKIKVAKYIDSFYSKSYSDIEGLIQIEEEKELSRQMQIYRLSKRYTKILITDFEILGEVCYERKRFLQENPKLKGDFKFYFISEDTHFSPKYIKKFNFYSRPISKKIEELFEVECLRAKSFVDLIKKKELNLSR